MSSDGPAVRVQAVLDNINRLREYMEKAASGYTLDYAQGWGEALLLVVDNLTGFSHPDWQVPPC